MAGGLGSSFAHHLFKIISRATTIDRRHKVAPIFLFKKSVEFVRAILDRRHVCFLADLDISLMAEDGIKPWQVIN
jgi:hypothetical protein